MEENKRLFMKDYLENFLTFFGLNISVDIEEDGEDLKVDVPSTHLNGFLIGEHGSNLRAIQLLANMALHNKGFEGGVHIDIAGYKEQRTKRLEQKAERWANSVLESGEERSLRPMNGFERRIVHKTVSDIDGLTTTSEGQGKGRHVIIKPTNETEDTTTDENDQDEEE